MVHKIPRDLDRKSIISVLVTSIIVLIYSLTLFILYIIGLILLIIINYNWHVIDFKIIKNALKNIALSAIIVFICTVLGEVWLHLYPHWLTGIRNVDIMGEFSDYTSRGYLTEKVFHKRPDVVRILGLGDSFAVYLKDKGKNYHNILEQKYQARGKGKIEVVSAGMESIGPGYYWHILNKYGDLFKSDMILVGFFLGNDFVEASFDVIIGDFIREPKNFTEKIARYYLFRNWRLYQLLDNKYIYYRENKNKQQEMKNLSPNQVGSFSNDAFLLLEKKRSWIFDKESRIELKERWRECSEIMLKMKGWCDRRKINLVIVLFPDQFQVDQKLRETLFNKYRHMSEKDMDLSYPNNLIVNFCQAHDIYCLDLLGPFQAEGKTRELYALLDTHWNEAGNRLAAEKIFEFIEAHNLVPARPQP